MDNNQASGRHLDASGPREVVYCHQCENEWYLDENGLECPGCEGEVTEIVSPESDPRPGQTVPASPPDLRDLHHHNPWAADSDVSDPEEADIEEHISHGPGGSVFISQTIRSHGRPRATQSRRHPGAGPGNPNEVVRDFQSMLGNLMGPNLRPGQPGRSGQDDLFPRPPMGLRFGSGGVPGGAGPGVIGGRFTYTGRLPPRNDAQAPPDIATYVSRSHHASQSPRNYIRWHGPPGGAGDHEARGGMPAGLQALFGTLLNPANARAGDAVYSQEALDQIISTLMEQHPSSNAPGPASPDAIAALPKKKLDETQLGPEGKGECSVCMDDVHIGDEVVMLPCNHWFHEICAGAWLGEHNTCPICRKGIEGNAPAASSPSNSRRSSQTGQPWSSRPERLHRRSSLGSRLSRENTGGRNEARLDSIRNAGRLTPTEESGPRRWQIVGDDFTRGMPGSYSSPRRRDSEMSVENQRDSRRVHTSGSDRSRDSRRSSGSASGSGNNGGTGPISWLRDRFSGGNDRHNRD
ncbi:putative RING finger [Hyphodiscus hymeniophilus]|uniref:RING-type E3 ubiquitin transferase n=1 Tax=Hyphodiscus hymeniophilus TaxID=353542 RepID=A0A9P6VJ84_9HELO|nr:putative RING finger [Hyphodiscus hymeniophilus]